jgi:hypothetical protein
MAAPLSWSQLLLQVREVRLGEGELPEKEHCLTRQQVPGIVFIGVSKPILRSKAALGPD